jgi:hypothetical protein
MQKAAGICGNQGCPQGVPVHGAVWSLQLAPWGIRITAFRQYRLQSEEQLEAA